MLKENSIPEGRRQDPNQGDYNLPGGHPLFVKLYPELSAAALKAGLDKELALWYELRAINVTGCGRLVLDDAVATLISSFGYSKRTVYRLLLAGKSKLWDIGQSPRVQGRSVIQIYSLYRVAAWFTIPVLRLSRPVEVPISNSGSRLKKRAVLYSSFHKPEGSTRARPISRDSIQDATGILPRQQRRYDKVAGIRKVANFAVYADSQGRMRNLTQVVPASKSEEFLKNRRLGNTYYCKGTKAARGMVKRVNAELAGSLITDEAPRLLKRFFLTAKSLIRGRVTNNEAFLLVNKRDRLIPGRLEWCMA